MCYKSFLVCLKFFFEDDDYPLYCTISAIDTNGIYKQGKQEENLQTGKKLSSDMHVSNSIAHL